MSVEILISEAALRHNLKTLSAKMAPAELMFVVKANGYGHGSVNVSKIAVDQGVRSLGVLEITSALELRAALSRPEINILAWQFDQFDSLDEVAANNIQLGVGDFAQLKQLSQHTGIQVHLKIDTGLNRNGAREADWENFVRQAFVLERKGCISVVAIWSHLAETSDSHDDRAKEKFEEALLFAETTFGRKLISHLSASSASFRRSEFRFDMVRTGGHVYGIPSFDGTSAREMGVIPVMTVVSKVQNVKKTPTGEFEVTVGAGFTHGIPGLATCKTEVAINGKRYLVTGVFAESMTVSGLLEVEAGEDVFIFGDGNHGEQTVREWADAIGTLGDEICCRISPSLKRTLVA